MPFVNIKTLKGALSDTQKKELHERITDLLVEIEGRGNQQMRSMVMVFIEELEPGNASMGGRQATEEFVKRITGR